MEVQELQWTVRDWTVHASLAQAQDTTLGGVLLLAGSGPTDRNWESRLIPGENGSGRLMAESLSEWGFVSLRFDKLGSGATGVPDSYSTPGFTIAPEDALAEIQKAADTLREAVPAALPLFVAGHSEGGLWALEFHRRHPDIFSGVILMGAAGRSQCDLIVEQIDSQLRDNGMPEPTRTAEINLLKTALSLVGQSEEIPQESLPTLPGLRSLVSAYNDKKSSELGAWLCQTDPIALLPGDSSDLLILQGGLDLQVHPEKDAQKLHEAAAQSTLVVAPEADHVLKRLELEGQKLNRMHAFRYNQAGRVLDPILAEALNKWLLERTLSTPSEVLE